MLNEYTYTRSYSLIRSLSLSLSNTLNYTLYHIPCTNIIIIIHTHARIHSHTHSCTHTSSLVVAVEHIFSRTLLERPISLSKVGPLHWPLLILWNSEKHLLSSLILREPLLKYWSAIISYVIHIPRGNGTGSSLGCAPSRGNGRHNFHF
jgi:hypothetical protein